jgi:hypothetical protein
MYLLLKERRRGVYVDPTGTLCKPVLPAAAGRYWYYYVPVLDSGMKQAQTKPRFKKVVCYLVCDRRLVAKWDSCAMFLCIILLFEAATILTV